MKYTPGTWIVRDETRKEEERVLYKPGPSFTVYSNGHDGQGDGRVFWAVASEIDEANARLISAAPDLYAALSAAVIHLEDIAAGRATKASDYDLAYMKKALDKAEGKERNEK